MLVFFLVETARGPDWDHSRGRRQQDAWDEHAAFMDALVEEGLILLGGPVGGPEGDRVLLVFECESEDEIRARMGQDPWAGGLLKVHSVTPWTVWLRP